MVLQGGKNSATVEPGSIDWSGLYKAIGGIESSRETIAAIELQLNKLALDGLMLPQVHYPQNLEFL